MSADLDLGRLERLAAAATPGPWTYAPPERVEVGIPASDCMCSEPHPERYPHRPDYEYVADTDEGHIHLRHESHQIEAGGGDTIAGNYDYEDGGIVARRDRDYIAAMAPDVTLALVARLRAAEQVADAAREYYRARQDHIHHGPKLATRGRAYAALIATLEEAEAQP